MSLPSEACCSESCYYCFCQSVFSSFFFLSLCLCLWEFLFDERREEQLLKLRYRIDSAPHYHQCEKANWWRTQHIHTLCAGRFVECFMWTSYIMWMEVGTSSVWWGNDINSPVYCYSPLHIGQLNLRGAQHICDANVGRIYGKWYKRQVSGLGRGILFNESAVDDDDNDSDRITNLFTMLLPTSN